MSECKAKTGNSFFFYVYRISFFLSFSAKLEHHSDFFQGLPASSSLMPEDLSSIVPEVHVWDGVWLLLLKKTADQM